MDVGVNWMVGKTERMAGDVSRTKALYLESTTIVPMALKMGASLADRGAGSGICWPLPRRRSAPGITRPSAATKLASRVASASRTPFGCARAWRWPSSLHSRPISPAVRLICDCVVLSGDEEAKMVCMDCRWAGVKRLSARACRSEAEPDPVLAAESAKTVRARRETMTFCGEFVEGDVFPRMASMAPVARMGARNGGPPRSKAR